MGIFNSLFAGQINESERSMKRTPAREREIAAYEEMRKVLTEEQFEKFKAYLELYSRTFDEEMEDRYIQGIKTGILMGIEAAQVEI